MEVEVVFPLFGPPREDYVYAVSTGSQHSSLCKTGTDEGLDMTKLQEIFIDELLSAKT